MIHRDTLVDELFELHDALDNLAANVDEDVLLAPEFKCKPLIVNFLLELFCFPKRPSHMVDGRGAVRSGCVGLEHVGIIATQRPISASP